MGIKVKLEKSGIFWRCQYSYLPKCEDIFRAISAESMIHGWEGLSSVSVYWLREPSYQSDMIH